LVVIDDPDSILRCTNKVYLAELLSRRDIPSPRTIIVHRGNVDRIVSELGLPCVLKQPDGAFSTGVVKAESPQALAKKLDEMLAKSELVIAQEYLATDFDWRVGVLDRRALFACKYFMAPGHWQVIKHERGCAPYKGAAIAVPLTEVPQQVLRVAVDAANLIGDSLYGVDLKQIGDRCVVIEINDNPNVDAGDEDGAAQDGLYRAIMEVFLRRIEARGPRRNSR
jgi:glutathione synthase/RimK-type ligase-like ATP-grasp enzyme